MVRVVDGPEYNVPAQPSDNPNFGAPPTAAIIWHTMSSSTDLKVFDGEMGNWRLCGHHEPYRKALCYFWAEVQHAKGLWHGRPVARHRRLGRVRRPRGFL